MPCYRVVAYICVNFNSTTPIPCKTEVGSETNLPYSRLLAGMQDFFLRHPSRSGPLLTGAESREWDFESQLMCSTYVFKAGYLRE